MMVDDVAMQKNDVRLCGEKIMMENHDFSRVVNYWGKGLDFWGAKNYWGRVTFGEIRMAYLAYRSLVNRSRVRIL